MAFATKQQLLEEYDISAYTDYVDIDIELERTTQALYRLLAVDWWPKFHRANPQYEPGFKPELLDTDDWNLPAIYYCLAYRVLPQIQTKTGIDFNAKTAEYHGLWEEAYRWLMMDGITYDQQGQTIRSLVDTPPTDYIRLRK